MSPQPEQAQLAQAVNELAKAINRFADLHDNLWMAMKPSARAKILGVSPRTEYARRKDAEVQRALR